MIKTNGNIKPKPFLKMLINKDQQTRDGSEIEVIGINRILPNKHFLESRELNRFFEINHVINDVYETVQDMGQTMSLVKFKGNNVKVREGNNVVEKIEYSYYLIPLKAILNDFYRTETRNNIIVELDPNYIFDEKYVSRFFDKFDFSVDDEQVPLVKVGEFLSTPIIDLHSSINIRYHYQLKTDFDIKNKADGKYPVIIEGAAGNSSNFRYCATIFVKTNNIGGIKHKEAYIVD